MSGGSAVRPGWHVRRAAAAAVGLAVVLAGCTSPARSGRSPTARPSQHTAGASDSARLTILPANGSRAAPPAAGITVSVTGGRIERISVRGGQEQVVGSLNPAGDTWRSRWALDVSQHYQVTATAVDDSGRTLATTSSFTTVTPRQTFQTQIFEGYRWTYGVGMPIELNFTRPITDKAAVERALQITTSKPVVGAWYWDGDRQVDFRPRNYWPAGTQVSFTGHLNGVEGAPGVYGYHTLTQTFLIGTSLIAVASTRAHHIDIYEGGRLRYHWPISTGRPGDDTPDGTYLTIEKANPVDMIGPGYNIEVPWSVRITFSGDYLHDAYWSVGEQGFSNVSHGCVNLSPADAQVYYRLAVPGDPVTITGSPRGGTWNNGWTEWFLSWPALLAGSATHQAVTAGPGGSQFVDPALVPATTAAAPLQTSAADNSSAT